MELPADEALRWIVRTYAGLRARHGEGIGEPATVRPTGDFFPDAFRLDAPSVERFLRRMIEHAPISDDLAIELAFSEAPEGHAGGCGSDACGAGAPGTARRNNVEKRDGGYRVWVAIAEVPRAELLAGSLSRAVGGLVLHEADEAVDAATSEVAAVACGFGVLLANGAAVWAKACGGLRMASATVLSVEEIGVALALFAALHGRKPSEARAHLGPTQREALDEGVDWVDSNPALVEALRDRPVLLEAGIFDLEPVRGPFGRWWHGRRRRKEQRLATPVETPPMTENRRRHLEDARALVDEVMGR
jgi:hypothetical protein